MFSDVLVYLGGEGTAEQLTSSWPGNRERGNTKKRPE
jgi:hypothetical protein